MHDHGEIKNPGPFVAPAAWGKVLWAAVALGVLAFGALIKWQPKTAWSLFVVNHFFFLALALGGLLFAAIQWVTGAMWSSPVRRLAESFSAYLPVAGLLFLVIFAGSHHIFEWTHADVMKGDPVLVHKQGYLNLPFFVVRMVVVVALWMFLKRKLVGISLAQDSDPSAGEKNKFWSPIFIIVFALSFTVASFDLLMSLDPHWFSTMFGVYTFAGTFYATLALLALATILLKRRGHLSAFINENHLHDIGKLMFAFVVFWAYIGFSQFMLIWYANLPEETGYFLHRFEGKWLSLSIFLLVGKFLIPFFALLPRDAKRSETRLIVMGFYMLVAQWLDIVWIVQPEFFPHGPHFVAGGLGLLLTLGFAGAFCLTVLKFWSRHNIVAIGDPKLHTSVFHHHQ